MKIYYSHPTTREYIGEGLADPNPLEPGNWLIPGGAYVDEPPIAGVNQAVIRSESGWVVTDDYRGTVYYLDTDQPHTVVNIGELVPSGSTPTPPPPSIEVLTARALAKRDSLLALAAVRIAPLQDAVDLDEATPSDIAMLKKWKQYRIAVNRITDQPGFPPEVDWPIEPS